MTTPPPLPGDQPPPGNQPPPGYGPPPPGYGPPPGGFGGPPPQASSTPMVLGIIGIVMAICCWPVGLTLGIISYVQAGKQPGGSNVVGIVAIALSVVFAIINIALMSTGHFHFTVNSS